MAVEQPVRDRDVALVPAAPIATLVAGEQQDRVDGEGYDAPSVIPTSDAEAEETAKAVAAMPSELRAAVEAWYCGAGGVAQKCRRLCIGETTLRERIGRSHRWLGQWLADRKLTADRERERVEAARRGALRVA